MARSKDGKYVFQMVGNDQMVMVEDECGSEVLFSISPTRIAETMNALMAENHEGYGVKLKNSKGETTYIDPEYVPEFAFWMGYYFRIGLDRT